MHALTPCRLTATATTAAPRTAEQSAALAAICAACTGLRSLFINGWWLAAEGLHPLSTLAQLRELVLEDIRVESGAAGVMVLPPLPLRRLHAYPHADSQHISAEGGFRERGSSVYALIWGS